MKISLDEVNNIIKQSLEPEKAKEIIKKIEIVAEEIKQDSKNERSPKSKNQFFIIAFDSENKIPADLELTGIVGQIPENDDIAKVLGKISTAAREQNQSRSGRKKGEIQTIGEAAQVVKRKYLKEQNVNIKTKFPVQIIISNNKLV